MGGLSRAIRFLKLRLANSFRFIDKSIKPNSLSFEISVLFALLMGVILAILCAGLYWILSHTLYRELDTNLTFKAQGIAQVLRSYVDVHGEDAQELKKAIKTTIVKREASAKWWEFGFQRRWAGLLKDLNLKEEYINFASYSGSSLYRSTNMSPALTERYNELIPPHKVNNVLYNSINFNKQKIRVINYPFSYKNEFEFLIQVGVYPKPITILLQSWLNSILAVIPIIMILTFFIGQLISLRILNPIRNLTGAARQITTKDLSKRIESEYYYREMNSLITEFNNMITRLEKSFNHIEEFGAHVAHELKTPLTIIKGESELMLLKERNTKDYQKTLRVNLDECEKMLKIVEDLLLLSRLDYQPEVFEFKSINLIELLNEIAEQSKILSRKKRIKITLIKKTEKVSMKADPVHLKRLFFNLIDNAIKFTPENGEITLKVKKFSGAVSVSIRDTGIGIKEGEIDKIFDRFYRVNPQFSGSGLGLNIALSIAHKHQGNIKIESILHQGTTFTVNLPTIKA